MADVGFLNVQILSPLIGVSPRAFAGIGAALERVDVSDCLLPVLHWAVYVRLRQTWNWVIGSPGQWVIFHVRVIILTRCETRVFPVFEKMPKMQNVHLKCGYKYFY